MEEKEITVDKFLELYTKIYEISKEVKNIKHEKIKNMHDSLMTSAQRWSEYFNDLNKYEDEPRNDK